MSTKILYPNIGLDQLLLELKKQGLGNRGRNKIIAEKTGYSPPQVSALLSGNEPLNERFLKALESNIFISESSEIYQSQPLQPDERELLKAYRQLNESDKGCALRMVTGLRGLEEQSAISGAGESGCKVVSFGSK